MCDDDLLDLRCLWRGCQRRPTYRHTVCYVGHDLALLRFLNNELKESDCHVDYHPAAWLAHLLLPSQNAYAVLLFDEQQDKGTGADLVEFARTLEHRQHTPCLIYKPTDSRKRLAQTIRRLLAKIPDPPPHHPYFA